MKIAIVKLYVSRTNILAKIWKSASANQLELPYLSVHGWIENSEMIWMEMASPENKEDLHIEQDNIQNEDASNGMDDGTNEGE